MAIIGVGNCANAFVQGVQYYRDADPAERVPGLMHVDLGGYHVRDIEFSAAFDIDSEKVGKDLSEAIWAGQNNTIKFVKEDVPHLGVPVQRGMTHDGLGKYLKQKITKAEGSTVDIAQVLKDTRTDVVVSYLPVGSEQATKWYVEQILEAGCAFVNCIPVFIAREDYWNNRFEKAGLPIVGDDIKSQVGATIVHRTLARLFGDRGVKLQRTSQLNVGGNMDFYNMLERERLESKKISKTNAVTSIMEHELPADDVHVGPSDYVPWLTDRKWAHIRLEGQAFGDVPLTAELKLEVWDSPNSAGIVIDAVRCCKLALNHGIGGQLDGPSSYLMKSPYTQRPDHLAREATEEFIAQHSRTRAAAGAARSRRRPRGGREVRRSSTSDAQLGGPRHARAATVAVNLRAVPDRFAIAQVTPHPWEDEHEVNAFVAELSAVLAERGHRMLVLAPSRSPELVRESRRLIRSAREHPERLFDPDGGVRVLGVGELLPLQRRGGLPAPPVDVARTIEEVLDARAAGLRARARAVRAERVLGRAAPLARAQRRLLPRADRAGRSRPRSRAASSSCSSAGSTRARRPSRPPRELMERFFPAPYRLLRPGRGGRRARRRDDGPLRIAFCAQEERAALRLFLRALRRLPDDARLAGHGLLADRRRADRRAAQPPARPADRELGRRDDRGRRCSPTPTSWSPPRSARRPRPG